MPTPRSLLALACALAACALAPAAALAAAPAPAQRGVVLSAAHHTVRLVDRAHRVSDVRVRSTRGLRRGAVVTVRGGRAHVTGHARKVSFLGRVVRGSARATVIRLGDGSTFKLRAPRTRRLGAHAAATLTLDLRGLTPGQTLLITIATDAQGNVALTIRVEPASTDIGDGQDGSDPASGDGTGGDQADQTDQTDCAPDDQACLDAADEVDGTVSAIAPDGSSITVSPDDGSADQTIPVSDPTVLDGVSVGDDVAVILDGDGTAIEVDVFDTVGDAADSGDA